MATIPANTEKTLKLTFFQQTKDGAETPLEIEEVQKIRNWPKSPAVRFESAGKLFGYSETFTGDFSGLSLRSHLILIKALLLTGVLPGENLSIQGMSPDDSLEWLIQFELQSGCTKPHRKPTGEL